MKQTFNIILALLSAATVLVAVSACANLRGDTAFPDATVAASKKESSAKSESLPAESTDEHTYTETALAETAVSEITAVSSDISEAATEATDLPEAVSTTAEVPEATTSQSIPVSEALPETTALPEIPDIDVDLATLSSTMVYAEVYNMLVSPDDYIGKTVRMKGPFAYYEDPQTGNLYFACIIADATACCSQGIEFTLAGAYIYPDDYPELGSEITVVGEFETYTENGYSYCHLANAMLDDA